MTIARTCTWCQLAGRTNHFLQGHAMTQIDTAANKAGHTGAAGISLFKSQIGSIYFTLYGCQQTRM